MKVLIVGGGQVGSYLANLLLKDGHNITVVEERAKQLSLLQNELPEGTVVAGGFTDPIILENAGIAKADVVVAVTAKDEDNLVISTLAKFEFAVPRVIARVNNPKNSWVFTPEMGVDVGLNEADVMAHLVAEEMSLGDMMTIMKLNKGQHSLVQEKVHPKSSVVGKSLRDLSLPVECVIFGVIRHSDLVIPRGDTVLEANDEILAVSHVSKVKALAEMLAPIK
ncbi:MAG: TrkA family potassium uptake protein [Oscillospiraceae bacterium]